MPTTYCIKKISAPVFGLLFLLLWGNDALGQSGFQAGLIPSVNLNKKFASSWKLNYKAESRFILYKENAYGFAYSLIDNSIVLSKKTFNGLVISGGGFIRLKADDKIYRTIQQFAWVGKLQNLRFGHRLASDQSFEKAAPVLWRFRYRWLAEIPLKGQKADAAEPYIKAGNEYLYALSAEETGFETRLIGLAGYSLNDKSKIEGGLDYRLGIEQAEPLKQRFWLRLNYFYSF